MWWNVFVVETTIFAGPCSLAHRRREVGREVLGDDLDPLLAGELGDVRRRVDPERSRAPAR